MTGLLPFSLRAADEGDGDLDPSRRPARVALVVVCLVAALTCAWSLDRDPLEPYYAAAVRSMAGNWHDFAFGAFDPDGTISLDKLPGAFWVQALSVRMFGLHTWALVLPQVLAGVGAVAVLYRAVSRLAGPATGLVAAAVLAVSPAAVGVARGNLPDPLMILLLVLAADAVSTALTQERQRPLLWAGVWVGLAFQVKMVEAWLVLPALAGAYLLAGRSPLRRRGTGVALLGAVTLLISLGWVVVVALVPASSRPYLDGSRHNSIWEQVFDYNGFGRFGQQTPLQVLAAHTGGLSLVHSPPAAWDRLLTGGLGLEGAWLLPAAVVIAITLLVGRRGEPRQDPLRAAGVLWGGWLLVFGVVLSCAGSVNPYYAGVLAPPVAALTGLGVMAAWRARRRPVTWALIAGVLVLSAPLALGLTSPERTSAPRVLRPVVLLAVVLGLLASGWLGWRLRSRPQPMGTRAAFGAVLVALLVAPATATVTLVQRGDGALAPPFLSARAAAEVRDAFVDRPAAARADLPLLERDRRGAPVLLATDTAVVASLFSYPSGEEVLPIGGFTGTAPVPTLDQVRTAVAQGRFHLAVIGPSADPRLEWIAAHCRPVPSRASSALRSFYCLPADAA